MVRYLRFVFLGLTALVLLVLALANRAQVEVHLLPGELDSLMGLGMVYQMPLFLVILMAVAAGVLIGFVWEWFRERRIRGDARARAKEVTRLERELAVLKDVTSTPAPEDDVLALLEPGRR
ncbi:LapA family protein [Neotabrizicola sp. sgz301269]|uniref:LapA family protein n=1 Tax=Neotabrizicola sp. sgz301269 TaxID=3276282 RepID=UPI00376FEBCE